MLSSYVLTLGFPLEAGQELAKCPDPPQYMHSPSFMRRDLSAGVMGPRHLEVDRSMASVSADGVIAGLGAGVLKVEVEEVLVVGVDGAEEERDEPYENGLRIEAWTERNRLSIFWRTCMVSSNDGGRSTVMRADFNSSLRPSRRMDRLASSSKPVSGTRR